MEIVLNTRTSPNLFSDFNSLTICMSMEKSCVSLHQEMPPHVLRDFIELAHIIHAIAHPYLDFYLEKAMSMKPQCLNDSDVKNIWGPSSLLYSEHQSQGQPYQPKYSGPPSYLEE
jgi:hypothetical protein